MLQSLSNWRETLIFLKFSDTILGLFRTLSQSFPGLLGDDAIENLPLEPAGSRLVGHQAAQLGNPDAARRLTAGGPDRVR